MWLAWPVLRAWGQVLSKSKVESVILDGIQNGTDQYASHKSTVDWKSPLLVEELILDLIPFGSCREAQENKMTHPLTSERFPCLPGSLKGAS